MKKDRIKNAFVYKKARQCCNGKPDSWVKEAYNEILKELTTYVEKHNAAPSEEHIDRYESTLQGLKDELISRGHK